MEQTKMKLGPLQIKWIEFLRNNPGKQGKGCLGKIKEGVEQMCCLGAAGLIAGVCHWDGDALVTSENNILFLSGNAYKSIGLRNVSGKSVDGNNDKCLSYLNDEKMTWPEIADLLEENPDEYFTHSI